MLLEAIRSARRRRRLRRLLAALTLSTWLMVAAPLPGGAASGGYDPSADPYSMANVDSAIGANDWWDAGYTGAGVDVAVIDTGVTPVPALSTPGKIVYGPDLSLDSQSPALRNLDSFGHGTFMAGLIAGHAPSLSAPYSQAPASAYRGVAPDARIVSIKVGATDGQADVSQVIAAIDWVVQHAQDPGLNIRVINLSYGTNSSQPYQHDPLAYAAEQAWKHGIVVVAAAGNTGYQRGHGAPGLADPAYDPYVIGVGGDDIVPSGSGKNSGATMGAYSASSNGQPGTKDPDFVAPGSHLQGLRVPGSYIDSQNPPGILDPLYMRGSGTSEAAAITSGAVALILQKYPNLTPDQVKAYIEDDADPLDKVSPLAQGAGELDLGAMLPDSIPGPDATGGSGGPAGTAKASPGGLGGATEYFTDAQGDGSLEASRGSDHISLGGNELTGEIDIFGHAFDSSAIAGAEAAGNSWSGGTWNGSSWSGSTWSGSTWGGSTWSGSTWSGSTWSGSVWSGSTWSGSTWSGSTWSGSTWSGSSWSGSDWSSSSWA
jgi:serine protease AprX